MRALKNLSSAGLPPWMATFADLMALMMCFFVLLFSFSQIDEDKYRAMVESMSKGFGSEQVYREIRASPTMAPPSTITSPFAQLQAPRPSSRSRNRIQTSIPTQQTATQIKFVMEADIARGRVAVETSGNTVIIRLPEAVAFPPGSDVVSPEILEIIETLSPALQKSGGTILVTGHTDDTPIASARFSSNWELSTDRAVAVIHELIRATGIPEGRFAAIGYGSSRPVAANDTPENRARNRRVEILIVEEDGTGLLSMPPG